MKGGPIVQLIRRRLKREAMDSGYSAEDVDKALENLESERPILDWLLNGGFEKLLDMVLTILALFGEEKQEGNSSEWEVKPGQ